MLILTWILSLQGVYAAKAYAAPGSAYTTPQGPELYLDVFGQQEPVLLPGHVYTGA